MKYLALLGALAIIYILFKQLNPVASVQEAVTQTEITPTVPAVAPATRAPVPTVTPAPAPSTTGLRAPITRTRSALDAVRKRNGDGEF